jgi:GNAT superfamily N-acetyltransferase
MTGSEVLFIRDACPEDTVAACKVMRRSISELCAADHGDDPEILARWLSNKTPENVRAWIAREDATVLVAIKIDAIVAVGMITDAGEVLLNYVSPDARFRGASRALLKALEERARQRGATFCRLESTETARRFYRSDGYAETGAARGKFGARSGYRMTKSLN